MSAADQNALKDFWEFTAEITSITSWLAKAAVAAPLVDIVLGIGPPWPSKVAVPILTCLAEVMVMMYGFQFWSGLSRPRLGRRLRVAFVLIVLTLLLYITFFSFFVYDAPSGADREVKGLFYQGDVQVVINRGDIREADVIKAGEYDPLRIWVPWSVYVMRVIVLCIWLLFFTCLASGIASFVLLERQRQAAKPSMGPRNR